MKWCWRVILPWAAALALCHAAAPEYLPAVWGVEEGLPQNGVTAVVQTRAGDVWCGTFNGLARFDGVKFTAFDAHTTPGLPGNGVLSLHEDRRGTLWVGLDNGKVVRIMNRVPVATLQPAGAGEGGVLSFGEDAAGDLWLLWQDGTVRRWRDGLVLRKSREMDLSRAELELVDDDSGALWLMHRRGFFEVSERGLAPAATGIRESGGHLSRATKARRGGLWVVAEQKLRRWYRGGWAEDLGACPWDSAGPEGMRYVTALEELRDGRLMVGMAKGGVALGMPDGDFRRYDRHDGLPHEWIRGIAEDREGNLWLATGGGGLAAMRPRRVEMVEVEPDEARHTVQSLFPAPDGSVWVATEGGGLFRRKEGELDAFSMREGLDKGYVWAVCGDRAGRIWAGTWSTGLFVKEADATGFSPAADRPAGAMIVTGLLAAGDGTLWAGG